MVRPSSLATITVVTSNSERLASKGVSFRPLNRVAILPMASENIFGCALA